MLNLLTILGTNVTVDVQCNVAVGPGAFFMLATQSFTIPNLKNQVFFRRFFSSRCQVCLFPLDKNGRNEKLTNVHSNRSTESADSSLWDHHKLTAKLGSFSWRKVGFLTKSSFCSEGDGSGLAFHGQSRS